MPRHCSAAGCKSRDTRETRKAGITFHRLPKRGSPRRTLWIINSQRTDPQGRGQWDPQSHFIYFCSKHFTPESFELSGVSGYRRLKEDALPTMFETLSRQTRGGCKKGPRTNKQMSTIIQTRRQTRSLKRQKGGPTCPREAENSTDAAKFVGEEEAPTFEERETSQPSSPPGRSSSLTSQCHPLSPSPSSAVTSPSQNVPPSGPQPSNGSPPTPSRPLSPSRYMRRLPPPPGFYLPREHSYAQLCPLVWRKRYDKAIESLEKSLRLLNAARRRENRLRHTLLRLRESRLKPNLHDGTRWKEAKGERGKQDREEMERAGFRGTEEREMEMMAVEMNLYDNDAEESAELGGWVQSARSGAEDEMGYCFYCGRGQEESIGGVSGGGGFHWRVKGGGDQAGDASLCLDGVDGSAESGQGRGTVRTDPEREEVKAESTTGTCCYYYYAGTAGGKDSDGGVQIVTVEMPEQKSSLPHLPRRARPLLPHPHPATASPEIQSVQLQLQRLPLSQQPVPPVQERLSTQPAGGLRAQPLDPCNLQPTQPGLQEPQQMQMFQQEQRLFLMESARDGELIGALGERGEEQQVFWLQENCDGHLVLLPVPVEEGENTSPTGTETSESRTQPLLVSGVGFQKDLAEGAEEPCLEAVGGQLGTTGQSELKCGPLSEGGTGAGGGDVRERLKEHLEGFQLQLSSEFIN